MNSFRGMAALLLGFGMLGPYTTPSPAVTRYIVISNDLAAPPYTNWSMAATNIQMAVNAASNGDILLVGPGDYRLTSQVSIVKSLVVQSRDGAPTTIMNGQNMCRCLYILNTNATVDGFTIKNGLTTNDYGGGVEINFTSKLLNCIVTSNRDTALAGGGGIMVQGAALISNCVVRFNQSSSSGGGIMLYSGGDAVIRDTVIEYNACSNNAGGIYIYGTGQVINCTIRYNTASNSGGGVYFDNGGKIGNSFIYGNTSRGAGAGVFFNNRGFLDHATVVSNFSLSTGGGLAFNGSGMTCRNCIVYFNTAALSAGNYTVPPDSAMVYCCATSLPPSGIGNIDHAPTFVNRTSGDFRLAGGSSGIDQGTNLASIARDFFDRPRPMDGNLDGVAVADIGAHEYALELNAQPVSNDTLSLNWDYLPLRTYDLQVTTNLPAQSWSTTGTFLWFMSGDPGIHVTNLPLPTVPSHYRLYVQPM